MAEFKRSIVQVHVRVDPKTERDIRKLSKGFRAAATKALEEANKEILSEALKASSKRLNAKMKKGRAVGRLAPGEGDGRKGLRWFLGPRDANIKLDKIGNDDSAIAEAGKGWAHGGLIGNPRGVARAGVQNYWRALERGSYALVGKEMRGFILGVDGKHDKKGPWAEGRLAVNARRTGAFNMRDKGPQFTIRNPIPQYGYLAAAEERIRQMVANGETVAIYQKHFDRVFDARGLRRISLNRHGVGKLKTLTRARSVTFVTRGA